VARLVSVNIGARRPIAAKSGWSGIDKRPSDGPVGLRVPAPKGSPDGISGLVGDTICDTASHGGPNQAVYAYAREDLDWWQTTLGQPLGCGSFGENLTTRGLDVTGARIGERWRIGRQVVLEVSGPRIPCATFAVWMRQHGWLKTFTRRAVPGAYLRIIEAGQIAAGDPITVTFRPAHAVSIGLVFRALTLEPDLLGTVLEAADYLDAETAARARRRQPFSLFPADE
jgi:MOSC domain-containing protein YiiM